MDVLEKMALSYIGTIPSRPESEQRKLESTGVEFKPLGKDKQLLTYFQDSEDRAMGYLAGPVFLGVLMWMSVQSLQLLVQPTC